MRRATRDGLLPFGKQAGRPQERQAPGLRLGNRWGHLLAGDRLQFRRQMLKRVSLEQASQNAGRLTCLGNSEPVVQLRHDPSCHLFHAAGAIAEPPQSRSAFDQVSQGESTEVKHDGSTFWTSTS